MKHSEQNTSRPWIWVAQCSFTHSEHTMAWLHLTSSSQREQPKVKTIKLHTLQTHSLRLVQFSFGCTGHLSTAPLQKELHNTELLLTPYWQLLLHVYQLLLSAECSMANWRWRSCSMQLLRVALQLVLLQT